MADKMVEQPTTADGAPPAVRMGVGQQFALSAYWFATNLLWGAMLIIIIPSQMKSVAPEHPAETAGLLIGLGAVPGLLIPLFVGALSDRCCSRWGRRRPYMVAGVALNLLGLVLVWWAGNALSLAAYVVGYFIVQIGNNTATGSYSGIIPDVVPESQRGAASGWMASMSQLGTIVGVAVVGMLMSRQQVSAGYVLIAVALVAFLAVTVLGTREKPRDTAPEPLDWAKMLKGFWIDPRKYPDFAWVWVTRALVVMGLWTIQEFMQYYLTDVVRVPEGQKEQIAGFVLATGLVCATVTGILGGWVSDRIGRKQVVYVSNSLVALVCVGFLLVHSLGAVYFMAAVFGLAYGAYYSVDWALACDVLPSKEDAAKDMAVWHIALVLPQAIALPVAGLLLGTFGRTKVDNVVHYTYRGYVAIFLLAAFYLILGALLLRNVRKAR